MTVSAPTMAKAAPDPALSLYQLLDPAVLADPYPLYQRLREHDPVHWDAFLHAWVVTDYDNVLTVLHKFSADRTPTPTRSSMGLQTLEPIAQMMTKQMLFMDAPTHARLRKLCGGLHLAQHRAPVRANSRHRQRSHRQGHGKRPHGHRRRFRRALARDRARRRCSACHRPQSQLKAWSADFAEMLGNFQHNPDRATGCYAAAGHDLRISDPPSATGTDPREGLIRSLVTAEVDGGAAERGGGHRQYHCDHGWWAGDHH